MNKGTKIAIVAVILLIGIMAALGFYMISGDKMQPNISINGINVGGLTLQEAQAKLKGVMEPNIRESALNLKFNEKTWPLKYSNIKLSYYYEDALNKAYSIGHGGGFFRRVSDVIKAKSAAYDVSMGFSYDTEYVNKLLGDISKEIDQEAADAGIRLQSGSFVITDEKEGRKLDVERAYSIILVELDKASNDTVELPVTITPPEIVRTDLEAIQDKLGEYATKFNAGDADRTTNIQIATASATNVLVKPGEIFSLNKTIGPRLAKNGYKEAKVIINNELVPGIGGGVCQVSSTLFNAALLANMEIVERKNHALPSSYVPLGRDATISGDYIDFKFKNNTAYPIYIYGEVSGSWVRFSIFGKNDYPGRSVKIRTEMIKKTDPQTQIIKDPTLPIGTEVEEKKAYTGYVVKTYRTVTENGQTTADELIGTSTYRVVNGVKRVGTKPIVPAGQPGTPPATQEPPTGTTPPSNTAPPTDTNTGAVPIAGNTAPY